MVEFANKKDENIKRMAKLLKEGATMLDLYCPQCNNILFKLKNETLYCPTCQQEVVVRNENENQSDQYHNEMKTEKSPNFLGELGNIRKEINKICININSTNDLTALERNLDILEKLIKVYNQLKTLR